MHQSFVHACGVRKVWTKEFQNLDGPSQQVKRLREILAGLGMDGRLSMEKAKAIKEKRDLAQELGKSRFRMSRLYSLIHETFVEDVRSFEQAVVGQPSRSRSSAKPNIGKDSEGDESGSDFANDPPTKHKVGQPKGQRPFSLTIT